MCRASVGMIDLFTTAQTSSRGRPSMLERSINMFSTLLVVLLVLWLLGMVTSFTMGGLIHILLVVAIVVVLVRVIQGRNPLAG